MVKHIVMWSFGEDNKAENLARIKRELEALVGQIPGLLKAEVGLGFLGYDAVLLSEFDTRESLEGYREHPKHLEAATFIRSIVKERAMCDFE